MALTIFIGDTSDYLAQIAIAHTKNSQLLDQSNYKKKLKGSYYTSLGDLTLEQLYETAKQADKLVYCPPAVWSDPGTEKITESTIRDLYLVERKNIEDASGNPYKFKVDTSFLEIRDQRKTNGQQIWVVGCSFAHGAALKESTQRYGQLVSDHFNLPVSFLSMPGSSVEWGCDQLMRADIKKDDIVIWGVTSVNRACWFDERHEFLKLNFGFLTEQLRYYFNNRVPKEEQKIMLQHLIFDDSRVMLAIRQITQAINYCNRISANLILMAHDELSLERHADWLVSFLETTENYLKFRFNSDPWVPENSKDKNFFSIGNLVKHRKYLDGSDNPDYQVIYKEAYQDLGLDKVHPGPKTHRFVADKLIEYIENKKYIIRQ